MLWPADIAAVERSLTSLRATLGEERAAATLPEGRALPCAEAVAVAAEVARTTAPRVAGERLPDVLTRREREVLQLLPAQQTDREIAAALFVSPRTVSWHIRAIIAKTRRRLPP
jgi:DNA-binding CsgD family transcriptional regulator